MIPPCVGDVALYAGVRPDHLADELRARLEAVLDVVTHPHDLGGAEAADAQNNLDVLAEFVAAVRLDLPIPYLPAASSSTPGDRP